MDTSSNTVIAPTSTSTIITYPPINYTPQTTTTTTPTSPAARRWRTAFHRVKESRRNHLHLHRHKTQTQETALPFTPTTTTTYITPITTPTSSEDQLVNRLNQVQFDRDNYQTPEIISPVLNITPTPTPANTPYEHRSERLHTSSSAVSDVDSQTSFDTEELEEDDEEIDMQCADMEKIRKMLPASIGHPAVINRALVRKVMVLYNPASGAKKGIKFMKVAKKMFEDFSIYVTEVPLQRKGHCEEIMMTQDFHGYDVVCLIGGDGTVHEAINGIMKRKESGAVYEMPPLGVIPGGTGNSFVLELQGVVKVKKAIRHICRGIYTPIDIFRVTLPHPTTNEPRETIYSFNSLHWGLASKVNVTAERMRWMGKAVRYTTAALLELIHGHGTTAHIMIEDRDGNVTTYKEEFCLAIANNIQTAAKGMKMAPNALLNDGLVDLLLIRSHKTRDLMHIFTRVYQGTHTDLEYVEYRQCKKFSITPYTYSGRLADEPVEAAEELIDIDGELKGSTPFVCEVIPRCLNVIL